MCWACFVDLIGFFSWLVCLGVVVCVLWFWSGYVGVIFWLIFQG